MNRMKWRSENEEDSVIVVMKLIELCVSISFFLCLNVSFRPFFFYRFLSLSISFYILQQPNQPQRITKHNKTPRQTINFLRERKRKTEKKKATSFCLIIMYTKTYVSSHMACTLPPLCQIIIFCQANFFFPASQDKLFKIK